MAKLFKRSSAPKEPVKQVRLKLRSIEVMSAVKVGLDAVVEDKTAALVAGLETITHV